MSKDKGQEVGKAHVKATADKAAETIGKPEVVAVFLADCKGTKGPGSTVAVVQGGSGKCRLYGKDSLANAFPDIDAICRTLTTADKMAAQFDVDVIVGKDACQRFMAEGELKFEGTEAILADKGKGNKRRGGFRAIDYATFALGMLVLTGCSTYANADGIGWLWSTGGYFLAF